MTVHALARIEERPGKHRHGSWMATCSCGRQRPHRTKDGALAQIQAHIADMNMTKTPCPKPRKTAYKSRFDAERAIPGMWVMLRGGPPFRAYECVCGRWHLTSNPLWEAS